MTSQRCAESIARTEFDWWEIWPRDTNHRACGAAGAVQTVAWGDEYLAQLIIA